MKHGLNGIGARIAIIGVLIVAAMIGFVAYAYVSFTAANEASEELVSGGVKKAAIVADLTLQVTDMKSQQRTLLIVFPKDYLQKQYGDVSEVTALFEEDFAAWETLPEEQEGDEGEVEDAAWEAVRASYDDWMLDHAEFMALVNDGIENGNEAAMTEAREMATGGMRDKVKVLEANLEELATIESEEIAREHQETVAIAESGTQTTLIIGVSVALLSAILLFLLYRSIATPLASAVEYADTVSHGDLSATYPKHPDNEIGDLTNAIESMKNSLVDRLNQLKEVAAMVSLAADSVSDTAEEVVATTDALKSEVPDSANLAKLSQSAKDLQQKSQNVRSALSAFDESEA